MGTREFELTNEKIDEVVTRTSWGNYALGHLNERDAFVVCYVGRADENLNTRLKAHVGEKRKAGKTPEYYPLFKFRYASSPKDAFETECRNYHDFGGSKDLDNENHPDRPDGTDWKCPVPDCTILEN